MRGRHRLTPQSRWLFLFFFFFLAFFRAHSLANLARVRAAAVAVAAHARPAGNINYLYSISIIYHMPYSAVNPWRSARNL